MVTESMKQDNVIEPVALSAATALGQVVTGSSAGSRYVCVIVGKHLNMAARINGTSLSVRVEPRKGKDSAFVAAKLALMELGLSLHEGKSYASVHLSAESPEKAVMGLAAIMAGFLLRHGGVHLPLLDLADELKKGA